MSKLVKTFLSFILVMSVAVGSPCTCFVTCGNFLTTDKVKPSDVEDTHACCKGNDYEKNEVRFSKERESKECCCRSKDSMAFGVCSEPVPVTESLSNLQSAGNALTTLAVNTIAARATNLAPLSHWPPGKKPALVPIYIQLSCLVI